MKNIIRYLPLLVMILFIILKVNASIPTWFKIMGKTTLMQGESVTYNLVIDDNQCITEDAGCAINIDGGSYFKGETVEEDIFDFISFKSDMGATYDEETGALFFQTEDGYAHFVKKGDIIGTIELKVKDDAKIGDVSWSVDSYFSGMLTVLEPNTPITLPPTESPVPGEDINTPPVENNETKASLLDNKVFLVGSVIGVYTVVGGLLIYSLVSGRKRN